jgi:hypothetical protein
MAIDWRARNVSFPTPPSPIRTSLKVRRSLEIEKKRKNEDEEPEEKE